MIRFKDHPQAWLRVQEILDRTRSSATQYFALQILEGLVKTRWKVLPTEQREGIKNYLVSTFLKWSAGEKGAHHAVVNRLIMDLVEVLSRSSPFSLCAFSLLRR